MPITIVKWGNSRGIHKTLKQRLEEFHGKDLEIILKEADESNVKPTMIDWGKPEGEEVW